MNSVLNIIFVCTADQMLRKAAEAYVARMPDHQTVKII
jgi:hypothetical protein